jgi:uncharacterized protein Yka (UPF0111/DUF47 family)
MLREQEAVTVEGMGALVAWARGEEGAADLVRASEHRADACKRELRQALTVAFTTPLEPEDLFELSKGLDDILNGAKDTVREAEVMGTAPDGAIAEMAEYLVEGTRRLGDAFAALAEDADARATDAADAAVKSQRRLERVYRKAMSALIDVDDARQIAARRELYRRFARSSERLVEVAERVWYAVLKRG